MPNPFTSFLPMLGGLSKMATVNCDSIVAFRFCVNLLRKFTFKRIITSAGIPCASP